MRVTPRDPDYRRRLDGHVTLREYLLQPYARFSGRFNNWKLTGIDAATEFDNLGANHDVESDNVRWRNVIVGLTYKLESGTSLRQTATLWLVHYVEIDRVRRKKNASLKITH